MRAWFFAWKLKRAANKLIAAQKIVEAHGYAVMKIHERAGSFYLENQKDKSLWRLKQIK